LVAKVRPGENGPCGRESGEDWNTVDPNAVATDNTVAHGLWVGRGLELVALDDHPAVVLLRPAYGSGEDWNRVGWETWVDYRVALSLQAKRGQ